MELPRGRRRRRLQAELRADEWPRVRRLLEGRRGLRSSIDPLTGEVTPDPLSLAASPADEAALEWALRSAERWGGRVRLVSAGGPAADPVLRQGAAVGATELVRVDLPVGWPSDRTARAVAPHVADAHLVWCGDMSADRGSGAFPAYLASEPRRRTGTRTGRAQSYSTMVRARRAMVPGQAAAFEPAAPPRRRPSRARARRRAGRALLRRGNGSPPPCDPWQRARGACRPGRPAGGRARPEPGPEDRVRRPVPAVRTCGGASSRPDR